MLIIKATHEMCLEIAHLKLKVWETTYKDIYPKEKFDNFNFDKQADKFKALIDNPNINLVVGVEDNKIIAYMAVGEPLRPFKYYKHEIVLLYILKDYQGRGFGKQLFEYGYNYLKKLGASEFLISCNKFNNNALGFYRRMGGRVIHIDEDFEDKSQSQVKLIYKIN